VRTTSARARRSCVRASDPSVTRGAGSRSGERCSIDRPAAAISGKAPRARSRPIDRRSRARRPDAAARSA
jgi:hypothetical protein